MTNFADDFAALTTRVLRERAEWIEDTIMAAMCARLPVVCVREYQGEVGVLSADEVVLVGGHVFGCRVVRITAPRRSPQA